VQISTGCGRCEIVNKLHSTIIWVLAVINQAGTPAPAKKNNTVGRQGRSVRLRQSTELGKVRNAPPGEEFGEEHQLYPITPCVSFCRCDAQW
jgi:hypothetical protein